MDVCLSVLSLHRCTLPLALWQLSVKLNLCDSLQEHLLQAWVKSSKIKWNTQQGCTKKHNSSDPVGVQRAKKQPLLTTIRYNGLHGEGI